MITYNFCFKSIYVFIGLNLAAGQPYQVIFLVTFMAGKLTQSGYFCMKLNQVLYLVFENTCHHTTSYQTLYEKIKICSFAELLYRITRFASHKFSFCNYTIIQQDSVGVNFIISKEENLVLVWCSPCAIKCSDIFYAVMKHTAGIYLSGFCK